MYPGPAVLKLTGTSFSSTSLIRSCAAAPCSGSPSRKDCASAAPPSVFADGWLARVSRCLTTASVAMATRLRISAEDSSSDLSMVRALKLHAEDLVVVRLQRVTAAPVPIARREIQKAVRTDDDFADPTELTRIERCFVDDRHPIGIKREFMDLASMDVTIRVGLEGPEHSVIETPIVERRAGGGLAVGRGGKPERIDPARVTASPVAQRPAVVAAGIDDVDLVVPAHRCSAVPGGPVLRVVQLAGAVPSKTFGIAVPIAPDVIAEGIVIGDASVEIHAEDFSAVGVDVLRLHAGGIADCHVELSIRTDLEPPAVVDLPPGSLHQDHVVGRSSGAVFNQPGSRVVQV